MENEYKGFKGFCKNNIGLIIYTFFLTIAIYGFKIVNYSYGMDSNYYILNQEGYFKHWISIGRFGEVLLKKYLWGSFTNIFLINFLTFTLFALSSILLCYLFDRLLIKKTKKLFIIPSLFITSQIFVYQFYFVLQNFEFAAGMILVLTSTVLIESDSRTNFIRYSKLILSILLLVLATSIYQSFALYYIGITVAILSLKAFNEYSNNSYVSFWNLFKSAIPYITSLLISLVVFTLLDKLIGWLLNIPRQGHETAMMLWLKAPFKESIISLLKSLKKVILMPNFGNQTNVYTYGLLFGLLLMIIVLGKLLLAKNKNFITVFICFAVLLISGLGMILATATTPVPRSMVPQFPFMVAFLVFYSSLFFDKKLWNYLIFFMVAIFTFNQVKISSNLVVAEQMTFEEDQRTIMRIVSAIDDLHLKKPSSYRLMIIGNAESKNKFNLRGYNELVGLSMFKFGVSPEPGSYFMNDNILVIMDIMGIHFERPTYDQYADYWKNKTTLEKEGKEFGIEVIDDVIIVKIS